MSSTDPDRPGVAIGDVIARSELFDLLALLTAGGNYQARLSSALDTLAVDAAITAALAGRADALVAEARAAGASWSAIGTALGVDRTAAYKRFTHRPRT